MHEGNGLSCRAVASTTKGERGRRCKGRKDEAVCTKKMKAERQFGEKSREKWLEKRMRKQRSFGTTQSRTRRALWEQQKQRKNKHLNREMGRGETERV